MQFLPYSQFDPKWANRYFPNADKTQGGKYPLTWRNWGCNGTCIAMLVGKNPNELMDENPDGWQPNGNAYTDKILERYGWKLKGRFPLTPGGDLPVSSEPYIGVTNFYKSIGFPTHFFLVLPSGEILDPAPRRGEVVGPKENKYKNNMIEWRPFERITKVEKKDVKLCGECKRPV